MKIQCTRTVFGLFVALGTLLAQDTPPVPTGIQTAGSISLVRTEGVTPGFLPGSAPTPSLTELFAVSFQSIDYTNYTPPPPADPSTVQTIGPCTVITLMPAATAAPTGIVTTPLDAGPVINLNGPNGPKQFPVNKGAYSGTLGGGIPLPIPGSPGPLPPYLVPGTYTVDNGGGGADIAPFSATMIIPDPQFEWTNPDANLKIDRTAGVDITFSGGDPNSQVVIQGTSSVFDPASFKVTAGASFICVVPNTGEFFVTPDVLSVLPATVPILNIPTSTLSVLQAVQMKFDAPIATTSTFSYTTGVSRSVTFQ